MPDLMSNLVGYPSLVGVQRTYNWDFLLPDIFGVLISGAIISKFCQSVSIGQYDIEEVSKLELGPYKKKFAGPMDIDVVTTTFITPVPDLVTFYFSTWKALEVNDRGQYNVGDVYKKTGHVILYDRTGIPSNIIRLIGLFPTKFPKFDLVYANEEAHKFTVTFSVDRIEMGLKALSGLGGEVFTAVGNTIKSVSEMAKGSK